MLNSFLLDISDLKHWAKLTMKRKKKKKTQNLIAYRAVHSLWFWYSQNRNSRFMSFIDSKLKVSYSDCVCVCVCRIRFWFQLFTHTNRDAVSFCFWLLFVSLFSSILFFALICGLSCRFVLWLVVIIIDAVNVLFIFHVQLVKMSVEKI